MTIKKFKSRRGRRGKKKLSIGRAFASRVKAVLRKDQDTHHGVFNEIHTGMVQNNIYTSCLVTEIGQGTSNTTRVGDSIFIRGFNVKLQLQNASTGTNNSTMFRWMAIETGIEVAAGLSGAWTTAGMTALQLFLNGIVTNGTTQGLVNYKDITVLADHCFEVTPKIASQLVVSKHSIYVPYNKKYLYQQQNSGYNKFKQIYFVAMAINPGSGVVTVGDLYQSTDIVFKNSD